MSETWLLPEIPNVHVDIPDFNLFRCDNGRGGGVCIYVRNELKVNIIDLSLPKHPGVEDMWLSVQSHMFPAIIVGCVYRHPKALATSFEHLQDVFRHLCVSKKMFYVLGDFNDDLLLKGNKLNGILRNNKLTQVIDKPTRVTSTSATLLDLIITNEPNHVIEKCVIPQVIADHDLVGIKVNLRKPKHEPVVKTFRNLGSYNKDILCELLLLESLNLNKIMRTDNVNQQVDILNDSFIKCLDKCAPFVTKEIKKSPAPWLNDDLRLAMRKRNEMRYNLKRDRTNTSLIQQYSDENKYVKSYIKNTKKQYYLQKLQDCKGDTSATWNIIHEIVPNKKKSSNTHGFESTADKGEEFNTFFFFF